jgi:UDP-N-acetylmuramate--alanine ligase
VNAVDHAHQQIGKGGSVHLIGVAGIGMSGIAFLLKERGFRVSGCDLQDNRQTEWLRQNDIQVFIEHDESHISPKVDWVIRSTAVPDTHVEIMRARELGIPVSRRGEVLPALMRDRTCIAVSGTHGKTTTTAMIAQILDCGYCIGGEMAGIEGVARDASLMVVEADESDGTVAGYTPDYAVITNIEYDHMEHHASVEEFIGCFERFVGNTKDKVYYCAEDPAARRICSDHPKCEAFSYPATCRAAAESEGGSRISLPIPGNHNQWNAAAARAACRPWKSEEEILDALAKMHPVRRRFETVYQDNGIQIISDYAHHPTEISAVVQAVQENKPGRLLAVFQPHRYTRTLALGEDFPASFTGVDRLWLVPVYAASEQPLEGGTSRDLAARFPDQWHGRLHFSETMECAWAAIQDELQAGDVLLILGAGDIEQLAEWARTIPTRGL